MDYIIEAQGIHKSFPGVKALDDVNFTLARGEILGLVGENGAGKSTLIKVLSGVHSFDSGTYLFDGKSVRFKDAKEAIDAGISVIHQELSLCETLSVAENICIGNFPVKRGIFVDKKETNQIAKDTLNMVGLTDISLTQKVEYLSAAQKQLVEIAREISRDSRVLIMDEPTSSLAPNEISLLLRVIKQLKAKGVSIVFISHKLDEIIELCDRVSVMRDGRMIDTLQTSHVKQSDLIQMMVGREVSEIFNRTADCTGEVVLEVEHLTNEHVSDLSFYVRSGEIVCFSGLMGAGRTEAMRAIFGLDPRMSGSVRLNGVEIAPNSTEKARCAGMGFVSENRKEEGIFPFFTVRDNMSIVNIRSVSDLRFFVNRKKLGKAVEEGIEKFHVKTAGQKQVISTLSGGNQQKVILARWLMEEGLKLLIVDEPTRGIDVGAKAEIYALLDKLAGEGLAILVVSSEMQEIMNVCDRVYIMKSGKINGELSRSEVTQTKLMECAIL